AAAAVFSGPASIRSEARSRAGCVVSGAVAGGKGSASVRAVLQRVSEASVTVGGERVGAIGPGALVLVGVGQDDDEKSARALADRIVVLRIFDDEQGRMNRSLLDVGGELLAVSQFTLWGDCRSGRRPSWSRAAPAERAEPLYR